MSLTGLQTQYTGYSINLAGGRITLLAMAFPFNLIDTWIAWDYIWDKEAVGWRGKQTIPGFQEITHTIFNKNDFFTVNDNLSKWIHKGYIRNIHWVPRKMNLFGGPHQHKRINPVFFKIKHILPYIFRKLMFLRTTMLAEYCPRSGDYFSDSFSKEMRLAVGMNATSSTPKGTKPCVVWATCPRPAIWSSSNWKENV